MMQTDPAHRHSAICLSAIALGVIATRVLFYSATHFTADDAFITFRYAANLALGLGFAYNPGEPVLGTTTPLFTLILALLARVGVDPHTGALVIGWIAAGLIAVVLVRYAESWGFGRLSILPVILYALHPRALAFDTVGMETPLFTLIAALALLLQHRGRTVTAIGMAAVAALIRPEGVLLIGVLFVAALMQGSKAAWRGLLAAVLVLTPWVVFAQWYFGSPIPNSIPAKLALYAGLRETSVWRNIVFLLGWHNPLGIALSISAVIGGVWLIRVRGHGRVEAVWIAALIGGLAISPTLPFLWYPAPVYPALLLLASATVVMTMGTIERRRPIPNWAVHSGLGLLTMALLLLNARTVSGYRFEQKSLEDVHQATGLYLREHATPADLVAAEDIGYIGYVSGCRILDRDGLVSPEVIPYNRRGDYLGVILDHDPVWVVAHSGGMISGFLQDAEFIARYAEHARFGEAQGPVYIVYKRIGEESNEQFSHRGL